MQNISSESMPSPTSQIIHSRINKQEISALFLQISIMLNAHLPLLEVIEVCAKNAKKKALKQILNEIAYRLNLGQNLSSILKEHRALFGNMTWNMVILGEKSGNLGEIFAMLSAHLAREHKNRGKLKRALFYPLLILMGIIGAFVGIMLFVLPHFLSLFEDFNANLPIYTKILIATESFLRDFWLTSLGILFLSALSLYIAYSRFFAFRFALHSFILHLPFLGEIIKAHAFYQYNFTLFLQLQSSIPLDVALSLTNACLNNLKLQSQAQEILESIKNGKGFSTALVEMDFLDDISLALINAGERSAQLPQMLEVNAMRFQEMAQERIDFLISLVEPILSLIMGVLLLFLALGVFVPMWDMSSSAISGM